MLSHCYEGKANNGREGRLCLPNLEKLGLGLAARQSTGNLPVDLVAPELIGMHMLKKFLPAKRYPSGHWEIAGVPVL